MKFERKKKSDPNLNIAPLIDVVFLLLLFFMLTSAFVAKTGIKILLPKAKSSKQQRDHRIVLYIDHSRAIYLNGSKVPVDELQQRLFDLVSASTKMQLVVIKADRNIDLGLAVKVIDMAKQANAGGVVISTEIPEERN